MSTQLPARTLNEILTEAGLSAAKVIISHVAQHPFFTTPPASQSSLAQRPPTQDAFQPLTGCPWCQVAEAVAGSTAYVRRAMTEANNPNVQVTQYYLNHALGPLSMVRGRIIATQMTIPSPAGPTVVPHPVNTLLGPLGDLQLAITRLSVEKLRLGADVDACLRMANDLIGRAFDYGQGIPAAGTPPTPTAPQVEKASFVPTAMGVGITYPPMETARPSVGPRIIPLSPEGSGIIEPMNGNDTSGRTPNFGDPPTASTNVNSARYRPFLANTPSVERDLNYRAPTNPVG